MFTFQENTHFSQALPCTKEVFWEQVRKSSTAWRVDARRAILAAVEASKTQGAAALEVWLHNSDYQKFLLKKQNLESESARQAWASKSDAEKLLAFAKYVKENSVAFIFSCYEFDATETKKGYLFRHRRLNDCHLNGLVMLDIDHVENPMQIWYKLRDNEKLMSRTKFVSLTSSGYGVRIVFTADISLGNLADNQIVFAQELGDYQPDESCIDGTRNSWAPKEEDIFFIDDSIFDYYDEDFDKRFTPEYREKRTQPLYHVFPSGSKEDNLSSKDKIYSKEYRNIGILPCGTMAQSATIPKFQDSLDKKSSLDNNQSVETKWRGYDIQGIIDQRYGDRLPCRENSNRHTESLKLATDLLLMLDGDKARVQQIIEAQPWVKEIIQERDEDVGQTVSSAADCVAQKEKKYASSLPSKAMLAAVKAFTGKQYQEIIKGLDFDPIDSNASTSHPLMPQLTEWGSKFEELFDTYPCMREICQGLRTPAFPAGIFAGAAFLGTDMTRTWYYYYHRPEEERRLNYCIYIIGDPATGKSFATRLYKHLAAPLIAADKMSNDAINRYKKSLKERGTSSKEQKKDALKAPEVIVRVHGARTANGVFIEDMNAAVEMVGDKEMHLHMLTFDSELDSNTNASKGGQWIDKSTMELKAFHNEEDNQQYKNVDSVNGPFDVFWNYVYTGTPLSLKKKVTEANFGSGLSTRLACIPMPDSEFEMMPLHRHSSADHSSEETMRMWAYRLDHVSGELPVWPLVEEVWTWTRDRLLLASIDKDKADEMLIMRVGYYGIAIATPYILMRHWDEWEKDRTFTIDEKDKELCQLILNIQYTTQHFFFGKYARNYFDNMNNEANTNKRRRGKTKIAFDNLPEQFKIENVMTAFGANLINARVIVCRLKKDGLVEKLEEGSYKKISSFV